MPADVRKGCAFPKSRLQKVEAMPHFLPSQLEAQPQLYVECNRKGTAFPHIGRQSRKIRLTLLAELFKHFTRRQAQLTRRQAQLTRLQA